MNDPMFSSESNEHPIQADDVQAVDSRAHAPAEDEGPQFGVVDIVEAFTALRHEWRGQTKESRLLAEQIQTAVTHIQSLEFKLRDGLAAAQEGGNRQESAAQIKPLVLVITETDHQLSRAISAIAHWEATRRSQAEADQKLLAQYYAGMNPIARWFSRPLLAFIEGQRLSPADSPENPVTEGLALILARLRGVMKEQAVERLDPLGQEFDANTMHAIGTIATRDYPDGVVAEQLSPAYVWQGQILRFADVRVARSEP